MTTSSNSNDDIVRVGAVSYLNTVPLIDALPSLLPAAGLTLEHPSRLADQLAAARIDIGLVPTIELARHPEWSILSDACIAARGPVLSVKLLFRTLPSEVRSVALDEGSRTSAALAQVLLADIHGVRPRLASLPIDSAPDDAETDAVLVIGDRAIRTPAAGYVEAWDLADRWCRWTELPFVFAVWAVRPGFHAAGLESALESARDAGRRDVKRIAAEQAADMNLPYDLVLAYLRDHLHFHLGASERRGLDLFFRRAAALDLAPQYTRFDYDDRPVKH